MNSASLLYAFQKGNSHTGVELQLAREGGDFERRAQLQTVYEHCECLTLGANVNLSKEKGLEDLSLIANAKVDDKSNIRVKVDNNNSLYLAFIRRFNSNCQVSLLGRTSFEKVDRENLFNNVRPLLNWNLGLQVQFE